MKRHLSVGEGYARKPLNFKPLPHPTCSLKNTSLKQKIGWLVTPISWAKVTGLTSLVALICLCLSVGSVSAATTERQSTSLNADSLVLGDSIPDWFWNTRLKVVNHPDGLDYVELSDYKDKLFVLNFWSTGCVPCIRTMDLWDEMLDKLPDEFHLLGVHLYDGDHKAAPFAEKKGWNMPVSVGNEMDATINRLFYSYKSWGQVWIRNGVFYAIPNWRSVNEDLIRQVLNNEEVVIQSNYHLTYMEDPNQ